MEQEVQPLPPSGQGSPIPYMQKAGSSPAPFLGIWEISPFQTWNILPLSPSDKGSSIIFRHLGGSLSFFPGITGSPTPFIYETGNPAYV